MSKQSLNTTFSERRIQRAIDHVSDFWLPVNQELVQKIQCGIASGAYDSNPAGLVSEIKSDISLFVLCIKRMLEMMRENGDIITNNFNPIKLLEATGIDELKRILNLDAKSVSRHSLGAGNDLQLARYRETLLSASTAETIAQKYSVDSEAAYAAAVLRQLGYALIAWNYPSLYEEAINSLVSGNKLDLFLTRELGFSPIMLASRLLHTWGVPYEAREGLAIIEDQDLEEIELRHSMGATVIKLCKVGEALARANDPEHYPSAREDWEVARRDIEAVLGPQGMDIVREKFEENCENYLSYAPHIFNAGLIADPEHRADGTTPDELNPYLAHCRPHVRNALRKLYKRINPDNVSKEVVRFLVQDTIPKAEFSGGCIFTMDPGVMMLMPQVEIGKVALRSPEPIDYSLISSNSDLVAVAYQASEPILAYETSVDGEVITAIAGIFGCSQKVGVLYLEIPEARSNDPKADHVLHFNALRHALNHCLNLR